MKKLITIYKTEITDKLRKDYSYANNFQIPKVTKLSINVGLGKAKEKPDLIGRAMNDLYLITGQKPRICAAKKAISGFKLRQGDIIGVNLTLRNARMYEFLDKLLNVSLPRVRDFRGLSRDSFDKNNNYTLGIKEHIIFPEISYEKIEDIYGLQITINTNAKTREEALSLLTYLGFPFKEQTVKGSK